MVAHATGHDGDDLAVARQLRGEENHRDEDEQRTEHIHEVWDEVQVVVKDDLPDRHLILEEVIQLLRQVKHDGNTHNQHNREEECAEELAYYVFVESLQNYDDFLY